ncbi:recombinase RecT [Arthrobacter sulfonylureivorans]|uniref:recombinase RecT n=1 Tax=Arthrobacter sulfonylureivorans TaxID=2486855 RepID=UPI0039E34504
MARDLATRLQAKQEVQAQVAPDGPEASIMRMENEFALAMPRGGEAAQLVRDAINVIRQTPKLLECSQESVMGSLMTCAQLGLRPGIGALGEAHILPFWSGKNRRFEAQFIIGYQGMLELGNRSNELDYLTAEMVCANDTFIPDPMRGFHKHEYPTRGARGDVIGYYSIFYRKGSERGKLLYMSREDVEAHRDQFATAKKKSGEIFGPWVDHFDAMALKTVLRLNFKYMPKSTTIQNALIADESLRIDLTPTADLSQVTRQEQHTELPTQFPGEVLENADQGTGELPPQDGGPTPEEMERIMAQERAGQ